MARHIVAAVSDLPPGTRKLIEAEGRKIAVFNVRGEYFAINDRCPHEGGSLCAGKLSGLVVAREPGAYEWTRDGEIIRCPWHGWEFDLRTGRSQCDPRTMRVKRFDVHVEHGSELTEDLLAETFPVRVENDYVVIEV
jgi:3-phenylpropionate/trans-cinnamate dioxygenase ferredoxin subunit